MEEGGKDGEEGGRMKGGHRRQLTYTGLKESENMNPILNILHLNLSIEKNLIFSEGMVFFCI